LTDKKHQPKGLFSPWLLGAGLLVALILARLPLSAALAGGIDAADKWAWGANVGWIDFAPANGGVTIYQDHLEGYAWSENVGWIRVGSFVGGGAHTYTNDAANTYGINNDGAGNLSGYAWSATVGWINFAPANGGVTIDPDTGDFSGYAWGENVGWIHFQNSSPAYKVNTSWRLLGSGGIDATNKWAWGANTGWINFAPSNGGVTIYSDHLEGYAWGENIGWIRLGVYTGGEAHTYTNAAADTYGINNDGVGNLSGYAWSANTGWVNFAPTGGGVWADPVTGDFAGYAWGENVGWIHFNGAASDTTAYKTKTAWHGDLLAAYQNGIAAIITTHRTDAASSNGLIIANVGFLNNPGDGIIFGHNNAAFANVTTNLPGGVDKRWARLWQLDVNDEAVTPGGNVTLTFDITDAGGTGNFSDTGTYFLLKRPTGDTGSFATVTVVSSSVSDDQLTFTVNASNLGSEFTVGATAGSPTAVEVLSASARRGAFSIGVLALGGLLVLAALAVALLRKR
jgi:hypothetical protein